MESRLAYSELDLILDLLEDEYKEKVPIEVRKFFKEEKDKNYKPNINPDVSLSEQNLKRETIVLLSMLNLNYWCDSEEEKRKILESYEKNDEIRKQHQKELEEKYNYDNLFKNRNKSYTNNESMIEYKKQSFIHKILNKIRNFLKKAD